MTKQLTHQMLFTGLFIAGATGLTIGILSQFDLFVIFTGVVRWTGPMGLGLALVGGTGMYITSRRHQKKKLKDIDLSGDEAEIPPNQQGMRFQDYVTSPEEATTVYTLFMAGSLLIIWGFIMVFFWIRTIGA